MFHAQEFLKKKIGVPTEKDNLLISFIEKELEVIYQTNKVQTMENCFSGDTYNFLQLRFDELNFSVKRSELNAHYLAHFFKGYGYKFEIFGTQETQESKECFFILLTWD